MSAVDRRDRLPVAALTAGVVLAVVLACSDAPAGKEPVSKRIEAVERLEIYGAGALEPVEAMGETRMASLLDVGGKAEICIPSAPTDAPRVLSLGVRSSSPKAVTELRLRHGRAREVTSPVRASWSDLELEIGKRAKGCMTIELRGKRGTLAAISTPLLRSRGLRRPWVILYVIDTLRFDSTPFARAAPPPLAVSPADASPGPDLAPAFESLAADGILYRRAFSTTSWTRPSVATLLTGLGPSFHRVYDRQDRLPAAISRLPMWLAEAGWYTEALSSNPNILPLWGFMAGFDRFFDVGSEHWVGEGDFTSLTKSVLASFERNADRPLFLYVHDNGPHSPYRPAPRYREMFAAPPAGAAGEVPQHPELAEEMREARSLYQASIRSTSDRLRETLDALRRLGRYDDMLFVLVGDHGEEFGEHGGVLHGKTLYQEQLHVPLVIKAPAGVAGVGEVNAPVSTESLASTLLFLLGIEGPEFRDTPRLPLPGDAEQRGPIYSELDLDGVRSEAAVLWPWKYLREGGERERVFDLESDPGETRDVSGEREDVLLSLRSALDRRRAVASAGLAVRCVAGSKPARAEFEIELGGQEVPAVERLGLDAADSVVTEPGRVKLRLQLRPAVEPAIPAARFRASVAARAQPDRDLVRIPNVNGPVVSFRRLGEGPPVALESPDGEPLAADGAAIELERLAVSVAPKASGRETAVCIVYYLELPEEVTPEHEVDPELRARLRALGYLHE